jgi:hypothetical protein
LSSHEAALFALAREGKNTKRKRPVKLELLTLAEYAAMTPDMKMIIAGTFNNIKVTPTDPATAEPAVIRLPSCYLVAVVNASISEGLTHAAQLRVLNADNVDVFEPLEVGEWTFIINPHGRPMRFQALMNISGLELPGVGEYSIELWLSGKRVGEIPLYVDAVPAT